MKVKTVKIKDSAEYTFNPDMSDDAAIHLALNWFTERMPEIIVSVEEDENADDMNTYGY